MLAVRKDWEGIGEERTDPGKRREERPGGGEEMMEAERVGKQEKRGRGQEREGWEGLRERGRRGQEEQKGGWEEGGILPMRSHSTVTKV